jgi:predicted methyltransferase
MAEVEIVVEELSRSQLNKIIHDPVKSAQAVQLVYVSSTKPLLS